MQKQPELVQRVGKNAAAMRKLLQTIDGLQVQLANLLCKLHFALLGT